jgi:hypothetical protein
LVGSDNLAAAEVGSLAAADNSAAAEVGSLAAADNSAAAEVGSLAVADNSAAVEVGTADRLAALLVDSSVAAILPVAGAEGQRECLGVCERQYTYLRQPCKRKKSVSRE